MKYSVLKTTIEHLGFFKKSKRPIIKEKTEILYSGTNKSFCEELFHEHFLNLKYLFEEEVEFQAGKSSFSISVGRFVYRYDLECTA